MIKRPYQIPFDGTADIPIGTVGDDPIAQAFIPTGNANSRSLLSPDGNSYTVGDLTMASHNSKMLLWSSEGFTRNGTAVAAVTATAKKASGTSGVLNLSMARTLSIFAVVTSFTGGSSPSLQFELDFLDDTPTTPVSLPIWKPVALTAAGNAFVSLGPGMGFPQAAAAADTPPTDFAAIVIPSGWIYTSIPLAILPQGQIKWTVTSTPSAIVWSLMLYGSF